MGFLFKVIENKHLIKKVHHLGWDILGMILVTIIFFLDAQQSALK